MLYMTKQLGQKKIRFAWLPIDRMVPVGGRYFVAHGRYWMRYVTVMWTLSGWRAFADDNDV